MMANTYSSLFLGYAVIWGIIAVYVAYLGVRVSRLEKSIKEKTGERIK